MRITFKRTNGEYIVSVNGYECTFETNRDAWEFIFYLRKEVA